MGLIGLIITVLLWIVGLVILYWVIRMAVRDGIKDAWRIRKRTDREAAGWDPLSGRDGFS